MTLGKEVKVALIGAGSLTFTPSLLKGLALSALSEECKLTIALMDIDTRVLDVMYKVGVKIEEKFKGQGRAKGFEVEKHEKRDATLEGADFVIVTVGVGGVKATHLDVEIPKRRGILQSIGDTVGPGGIMRAFRHVPLMLDISRDIKDLCPDAYLFNYSNPLTPLTRAVRRETKVRCYGLCTGPYIVRPALARCFKTRPDDVWAYIGGINHLFWIKDFSIKGEGGYPLLERGISSGEVDVGAIDPIVLELYRTFGILPAIGLGRHVAEFFPNLFMQPEAVKKYDIALFPKDTIYDYENRSPFESMLREVASGSRPISVLLEVRGLEEEGIGVVSLMEAIALDRRLFFPGINVPNEGVITNLPPEGVVEVSAFVDSTGIHPISIGPLPKGVASLLRGRLDQYELTVDAAILCDRSLATQSLLLDGYVRSVVEAGELLEEMLKAEEEWLPRGWYR